MICYAKFTLKKYQIEDNRRRLVPIVKIVILCGRTWIAYRGHRDENFIQRSQSLLLTGISSHYLHFA